MPASQIDIKSALDEITKLKDKGVQKIGEAIKSMYGRIEGLLGLRPTPSPIPPRPVLSGFEEEYLRNPKKARDYSKADRYADYVEKEAAKRGLDALGVLATAGQESNYNPNKRGGKGELGLMQILPRTALNMKRDTARLMSDPYYNISTALDIMQANRKIVGNDRVKSHESYNYGPGRVAAGKVPEHVKQYGREVEARRKILEQMQWDKKYGKKQDR